MHIRFVGLWTILLFMLGGCVYQGYYELNNDDRYRTIKPELYASVHEIKRDMVSLTTSAISVSWGGFRVHIDIANESDGSAIFDCEAIRVVDWRGEANSIVIVADGENCPPLRHITVDAQRELKMIVSAD